MGLDLTSQLIEYLRIKNIKSSVAHLTETCNIKVVNFPTFTIVFSLTFLSMCSL